MEKALWVKPVSTPPWAKPVTTPPTDANLKKRKYEPPIAAKPAGAVVRNKPGGGNFSPRPPADKKMQMRGGGSNTGGANTSNLPDECWQCGRKGHRYRIGPDITCKATTCAICKAAITPGVKHDTRRCKELKDTAITHALKVGVQKFFMKDGELWVEGDGPNGSRPFY